MTPMFVKNVGKKIKREVSPDAGCYEPHKKFGTTNKKITFGSKYKFKADSNPCPGQYQPSFDATRAKTPTFDWSKGSTMKRSEFVTSPKKIEGPGKY